MKRKYLKISVCAGLLAALMSSGCRAGKEVPDDMISSTQILAWWGTLYPQFCFQERTGKIKNPAGTGKPEISFWLAKVLDW